MSNEPMSGLMADLREQWHAALPTQGRGIADDVDSIFPTNCHSRLARTKLSGVCTEPGSL